MAKVDITIEADDVLELLTIKDILEYYAVGEILTEIGEQEAIDHFGIEVAE
ncbi:hypothetical protein LCGC14_2235700 [marine sediment metagenome]|uniref:Uncharacterized protein n=1 Tax=marine sediment metagenome TaxID=412755 RepID=A0A0F9G1Z1_9ZZZZ